MAKQHVAEQETLGEAMNKTEFFFEKNGRMLSYVFLGLLVLAALVFGLFLLVARMRDFSARALYHHRHHTPGRVSRETSYRAD